MMRRTASSTAAGGGAALAVWALALGTAEGDVSLPGVLRLASSDAFLLEVAMITLGAPLLGAAAARRTIVLALVALTVTSLVLLLVTAQISASPAGPALRGHLALFAVALALAGLGAAARALTANPLDAAGAALAVSIVLSWTLLVAGPATADLSEGTINAGLLATPPVAVTAAAGIDLLRTDVLYQLSPISHRRFSYPSWQATTLAYGALAACCFSLTLKGSR